jgi:copper chaperone CopZ
VSDTPSIYSVSGMTCDHCRRAVLEEVSAVAGVESAQVDLARGELTVVGDASPGDVAHAVHEAGYTVAT